MLLRLTKKKLAIVADQYDMVMNGYEICSGAVRNHNPEVMYKVFSILGYDVAYVEGASAVCSMPGFGAPPHAGCAFYIERIFMVLEDAKTFVMILSPSEKTALVLIWWWVRQLVDTYQLEDTHIAVIPEDAE